MKTPYRNWTTRCNLNYLFDLIFSLYIENLKVSIFRFPYFHNDFINTIGIFAKPDKRIAFVYKRRNDFCIFTVIESDVILFVFHKCNLLRWLYNNPVILKNVRGRETLTHNKKGIKRYRVKQVRTVMSTLFN